MILRTMIASAWWTFASMAGAQGWTGHNGPASPSIARQVGKIDDSIRDGRRAGQLSRREAKGLRRENNQIGNLADRYAAGGMSESERAELQARTEVMRSAVNARRSGYQR